MAQMPGLKKKKENNNNPCFLGEAEEYAASGLKIS